MAAINVLASKSLTVSNKNPTGNKKDRTITVGNDCKYHYYSYLFFDTSIIPNYIALLSATLLLFKVSDFFNCNAETFTVYPLLKQFSSFTTDEDNCSIDTDPALKRDFFPFTSDVAIEMDITPLVDKWINNSLVNRGIVIKGNNPTPYFSSYTSFGSAYSKDNSLIPFIRVTYKQGPYISLLSKADIEYSATVLPVRRK
jgi:hypothetical protein